MEDKQGRNIFYNYTFLFYNERKRSRNEGKIADSLVSLQVDKRGIANVSKHEII